MANTSDWHTLQHEVRTQHSILDQLLRECINDYSLAGKRIHCGKGCRECCNLAVNCTYTEAVSVAAILTGEQTEHVKAHAAKLLHQTKEVSDLKSYLKLQRQSIGF